MTNKLITAAKAKEKDGDILGAIDLYKVAWREDSKNIFLQIEIGNLYAIIEEYEEDPSLKAFIVKIKNTL